MSKKATTNTEFETALKNLKAGDWVALEGHKVTGSETASEIARVEYFRDRDMVFRRGDSLFVDTRFSIVSIWKGKSAPKSIKPSTNWICKTPVAETAVEKKEAKPKKTAKRVSRDNWDAEEVIKFLQKRTSRPLPGAEFPPTESEQEALRLLEEANHVICRLRDDQSQAHSFMQSAINRLKVK